MTYLYPDLCNAIHGEMDENGRLKNGQFAQLCDISYPDGGLPLPKVRLHDIGHKYSYDISRWVQSNKDFVNVKTQDTVDKVQSFFSAL